MEKHTIGKWIFEPHGGYGTSIGKDRFPFGYISAGVGHPIFVLDTVNAPPKLDQYKFEVYVANACLMAAAPEMLEALKVAREELVACYRALGYTRESAEANHVVRRADSAIAKAVPKED